MSVFVKSGGIWRDASSTYVKDSGVWRQATEGWIKSGGVWRQFLSSGSVVSIVARGARSPNSPSANGGVNSATYSVSGPLTFNVTFAGAGGAGGNYAAVYFGPVTPGNLFVVAGGGGAYGSQNGGQGGVGGGANGAPGESRSQASAGGGGVTFNSGFGPGGSGGAGGPHSGRGSSGVPGLFLQGAPPVYSGGGGAGYYGGGGGGANYDANTGGGGGGGSGLIRNWSFPSNVTSIDSSNFSAGGNSSTAFSVNITIDGTPYSFTSNGSVSV